IYSRVSRGIRPLYGCWVYSLYCVYPLSIREESRTIYPLNTGEKLAERARIGIEPVGPYAYGTHEHKMRGPGARVSHAGTCPSHTGPRPATPIQLSVRWDRHPASASLHILEEPGKNSTANGSHVSKLRTASK